MASQYFPAFSETKFLHASNFGGSQLHTRLCPSYEASNFYAFTSLLSWTSLPGIKLCLETSQNFKIFKSTFTVLFGFEIMSERHMQLTMALNFRSF